jgi:hypothetical protein
VAAADRSTNTVDISPIKKHPTIFTVNVPHGNRPATRAVIILTIK